MSTLQLPANLETNTGATGYGNSRKIDHFQNGYVVASYVDGSNILHLVCSPDQGVTWIPLDSSVGNVSVCSMFIDADDYIHIAYLGAKGNVYYVRGTPNQGRTAVTWGPSVYADTGGTADNSPDIVAFRDPSGAGWRVWVIFSFSNLLNSIRTFVSRIDVSVTGAYSSFSASTQVSGNYANNGWSWPSIDFQHTGDGKTPVASPKLYAVWTSGTTGVGQGVRAAVASYANGAWTWGSEIAVDTAHYSDQPYRVLTGFFDGTRFVAAGSVWTGTHVDVMLYDAIDTTPASHTLITSYDTGTVDGTRDGSATYDSSGNVYLMGDTHTGTNFGYYKWTRSGSTFSGRTVTDAGITGVVTAYAVAKRNTAGGTIEWIYTQGANSPYAIKFDQLTLTAPTTSDPIPDIEDSPTFDGQSVPDSTDIRCLSDALQGQGVVTGLGVSADGTDMILTIAPGKLAIAGVAGYGSQIQSISGATLTVTAASASDRRDAVVWVSGAGYKVIAGTACGTAAWTRNSTGLPPVKPQLPLNSVLLAEVYVASTTTLLASTNLVDKRQFVPDQTNAGSGLGVPPILRAHTSSTLAYATNSTLLITGMTADEDNFGGWDTTNNLYNIPVAGLYSVSAQLNMAGIAAQYPLNLQLQLNGSATNLAAPQTTGNHSATLDDVIVLADFVRCIPGDHLRIALYQNSGGNLNLVNAFLKIVRISA